jgi:hypothetical protein
MLLLVMNCSIHEMSNDKKTLKTGEKMNTKTRDKIYHKILNAASLRWCTLWSMLGEKLRAKSATREAFTPAQRERAAGNTWMK